MNTEPFHSNPDSRATEKQIIAAALRLNDWLVTEAFPRWHEHGFDPRTGRFFESIDIDSGEATDTPIRVRVPARQIYCFAEAGRLGWSGPWQSVVERGLDWYLNHCRHPETGFTSLVDIEGSQIDTGFDIYNQAFALFAFAFAAQANPELRTRLYTEAETLLAMMRASHAHPTVGFLEADPKQIPLRSNPHMHLFEAAIAYDEFGAGEAWTALADELAELAMTKFIDPVSGGLREYFDLDWQPMPGDLGRIMEPGHQFEWCWLLIRWGMKRDHFEALSKARRLYQIGRTHGIDPDRQVVIMAMNDDFTVRDPLARLWGQTEWLKAAIALARLSVGTERASYLADILSAIDALEKYLTDIPSGLWRDKFTEMHTFSQEPAPASTFYHIVRAIDELTTFSQQDIV